MSPRSTGSADQPTVGNMTSGGKEWADVDSAKAVVDEGGTMCVTAGPRWSVGTTGASV